jgi:hypothetical protein
MPSTELPNEPTTAANKEVNENPMAANPSPAAESASIQQPSFDTLGESSSNPTK